MSVVTSLLDTVNGHFSLFHLPINNHITGSHPRDMPPPPVGGLFTVCIILLHDSSPTGGLFNKACCTVPEARGLQEAFHETLYNM